MPDPQSPKSPVGIADLSGTESGAKADVNNARSGADDPDEIEVKSFLAPPQADGELGRLAHYRVLKELGRGGMGMVLLAEDVKLRRLAAIKIMLPRHARNAQARERFLREARSAAKIKHDNIITIFQVDEANGIPFIAMEFLKGEPLDLYLKEKGELKLGQAMRIGREIAEGLQAAHAEGLIHRDIKPANVWLEAPKGRVKILDFGLAREERDETHITNDGAVVGTPAFMSPEQADGRELDHRSDLFSLGVVLYRLCAGRQPFSGPTTMAVLKALSFDTPTPVRQLNPAVPAALEQLIERLLAKDREQRPAAAEEVAEALAAIEKPAAGMPKLVQEVVYVPMATQIEADPFAGIDDSGYENPRLPRASADSAKKPPVGRAPGSPKKPISRHLLFAELAGALAIIVAAFIIIKITNKDGSVTELKVPDDSKVEVVDRGKTTVVVDPKRKKDPIGKEKLEPKIGLMALEFDGKSSYVTIPSWKYQGDHPLTLEAWAILRRSAAEKVKDTLMGNPDSAGFALGNSIGGRDMIDPRWTFIMNFGGKYEIAPEKKAEIPRNKPVHIAGVYDGKAEIRFYVNGKLQSRTTVTKSYKPSVMPFTLGANPDGGDKFVELFLGQIRAVRVSKAARYDDDFTPATRLTVNADTIALYNFDEGAGDLLKDSSGNNHHGKIVGAKWVKAEEAPVAPPAYVPPAFDEKEAKRQQEDWAAKLKLPVEAPNKIGMKLRLIPPAGAGLPYAYYLGKFEVTQGEWEKVMSYNPSSFGPKNTKVTGLDTTKFPVEMVNWLESVEFCNKLSEQEGLKPYYELTVTKRGGKDVKQIDAAEVKILGGSGYHIPTDAEWTHGCRAGTKTKYHFGDKDEDLPAYAWFGKNSDGRPHAVGEKKPNAFGLYDMHGNMREWNQEIFYDGRTGAPERNTRGGNWSVDDQWATVASLRPYGQVNRGGHIGLRLARSPFGLHDDWIKGLAALPLSKQGAALAAKLKEGLPGFEEAWLMALTAMPADRQVLLVTAWLKELNPGFDGKITPKIEGGVVTSLEAPSQLVQDLTPLQAFTGLRTLTCRSTAGYNNQAARDAAVLRSLKSLETINGKPVAQFWKDAEAKQAEFNEWLRKVPAMPAEQQAEAVAAKLKERNPGFDGQVGKRIAGSVVTELNFKGEDVTDLSPVRALVGLKVLRCDGGPLSDLSPLKGMPLTTLNLHRCSQVQDLKPLEGMPLTKLDLYGCSRVRFLEPLKEMKLTSLSLRLCFQVRNLSPLKGMPLTFLSLHASQVQDLSPLKDMPLSRLEVGAIQVRDLDRLKGMPLTFLELNGAEVRDLAFLKDMKLTSLVFNNCTQVRDLEPLKDMKLTKLELFGCTQVRDLEPLKDMQLKRLCIDGTGVTDLRPLQGMPLEDIRLTPKNITQGLDILRDMKSLKTIGIQTIGSPGWPAAEFWERYDKGEFKK